VQEGALAPPLPFAGQNSMFYDFFAFSAFKMLRLVIGIKKKVSLNSQSCKQNKPFAFKCIKFAKVEKVKNMCHFANHVPFPKSITY